MKGVHLAEMLAERKMNRMKGLRMNVRRRRSGSNLAALLHPALASNRRCRRRFACVLKRVHNGEQVTEAA